MLWKAVLWTQRDYVRCRTLSKRLHIAILSDDFQGPQHENYGAVVNLTIFWVAFHYCNFLGKYETPYFVAIITLQPNRQHSVQTPGYNTIQDNSINIVPLTKPCPYRPRHTTTRHTRAAIMLTVSDNQGKLNWCNVGLLLHRIIADWKLH